MTPDHEQQLGQALFADRCDVPPGAADSASQRILRLVLDSIPLGVFWKDRESRYLGCNRHVAQAFGFPSPDDIVGKVDFQLPGLTREQAEFFVAKDREVMASGAPQLGIIEPATLPDGSTIWMETNKIPVFGAGGRVVGVLGTWQDVTERHRAEEALRRSETRLAEAQRAAHVGSWEVDLIGGHTSWSEEGYRLLGFAPGEVEPTQDAFMNRVHPDDRASVREELRRAIGGVAPLNHEFRVVWPDGRVRWLLSRGRVEPGSGGGPGRFLGISLDVTERKENEESRRKFDAHLRQAQKLESLGVLAGGIAHDFNNLLMGILGYCDLALLELPAESPARPLIREAVRGARRAAELTAQMLAYSGQGRFVVERVNLSALAEEMNHLLRVSVSKKCALRFRLAPDLPAVEADAAQLRQMLLNLVVNASEAVGDRSGTITIATGVVPCNRAALVEAFLDDNLPEGTYAFLQVADDGCGMTEETRLKIFDPFFTTKFTGRGLGLSAVLGIIRGHRGAIQCCSEPGKGTTFRVLLPTVPQPARPSEVGLGAPTWRSSGIVLVVDDEPAVRDIAQRMLESLGFSVLTAADGGEALKVYRTAAERIRFVLLDMTMASQNGGETLHVLRQLRPGVKVIISSGYSEQMAADQLAQDGSATVLKKPYRLGDLAAAVRQILSEDSAGT